MDALALKLMFDSLKPIASSCPGLVPGIHAAPRYRLLKGWRGVAAWVTGTSPVMTFPEEGVRNTGLEGSLTRSYGMAG